MFNFLFGKRKSNIPNKQEQLNDIYAKLKEKYSPDSISEERKAFLRDKINLYGYLNYPYTLALEELSNEEILYGLEIKWKQNGVFKDGKFSFDNDKVSVLARNNVKNSDWFKKEGHDIKLINLAGLGDGNKTKDTGKFMDWLRQLLILPTGNLDNGIFNTTIYLIPFHPREFGCAYLPKSSEVSEKLFDKSIFDLTGMDVKTQVQIFIELAQLAGHPVIYDILPQTGRFSKAVLANPEIARWFDIPALDKLILESIDSVADNLKGAYDSEDVDAIRDIYKQAQSGSIGTLSEHYLNLFEAIDKEMVACRKQLCEKMCEKSSQEDLHKRVKKIVADILGKSVKDKLTENDVDKQIDIIKKLIDEGLWPAPGGAWCSAGVPVYDKMSDCGGYPTFKHYDYKGEDVTHFANLDCQTPYYFVFLENGTYNKPVVEYFIGAMQKLQEDYNFDGFRVDHIDHVVDPVSEAAGVPISYRAPREVLRQLNNAMKSKIPYFATLAEYMLWDNFFKEYHKGMNFDLLWGNDIVSQQDKTPEKITEDNQTLTNYNVDFKEGSRLSILKAYNNQDGEFREIDQYPGQLTADGALYKWAKYKLLPGGKFAQRPMLYIDGDESFTKRGIEGVIGEEISMARENNFEFYEKFDAIDRFVKSQPIITEGEAQIIRQDDDGFAVWLISCEPSKKAFMVVSNYKYPTEFVTTHHDDGSSEQNWVKGQPVMDKEIKLPADFKVTTEYVFKNHRYTAQKWENSPNDLKFEELRPSEFRIFALEK